jgi:hypothetical protein
MATVLTAAVQAQYGRVLLQLTFTTVTLATVSRVHADGSIWPVRNADPVDVRSTTGVGAIIFDHEAPLDQAVTYKATSTQTSTTFLSPAVTVASDPAWVRSMAWLTHPTKPSLSTLVAITDMGDRSRPARVGLLPILGRADPIAVTDVRQSGGGELQAITFTVAEAVKLRALLADGGTVLLRAPGAWANGWQYMALGDATESGPGGWDPIREWRIGYSVVAPPAGDGQGAAGATWADVMTAYATWTAAIAGEPTWLDVQIKAGP